MIEATPEAIPHRPATLPGDAARQARVGPMIRVNQAGELGAREIYRGQIAVLKDHPCAPVLVEMAEQENEHLAAFDKLIAERGVRPTALSPIWRLAGYALGAGSALLGERAAMATTVAVEEVIVGHYLEQLDALGRLKTGGDEAELRATFDAHPARYAVLGAHILLRDRAQADSVHSEIEQGRATFEEMARKHSLDENTAKEGGVFKTYYAYDRVSDAIYKQVFSLDVGKVSEPFRSPQGWEVAKVVDKKLVPFEKYRTVIQRVTFLKKLEELKRSHIAELVEKSNLRPVVENLYRFIAAWNENPGSPKLTPEELAKPLYTYEDGMISLQQVSYLLHNIRLGHVQVDSTLIEDKVRNRGASDLLLGIAAKEAGLDARPIVQEQVKAERERLLVEGLWDELLEIQLEINEVEARTHYDAHPEMYKIPEEIIIQEIMVADIDRANSLLNEVRAGADMADLATRHSIRRYSDENGGLYAMRSFERIVYNEVMDAAVKAPDNELQGPIELVKPMPSALRDQLVLDRAFSIFKVLQRLPERVQTFELSQRKAEFFARQEKQQDQLQKLNLELRRKYNKDWGINDRALEEYAEVLSIR